MLNAVDVRYCQSTKCKLILQLSVRLYCHSYETLSAEKMLRKSLYIVRNSEPNNTVLRLALGKKM